MFLYLPFEHGGMLEHIGQHNKDNLRSPDVDLVDFAFYSVNISDNRIFNVQIHLIFCFKQKTPNQFTLFGFDFDDCSFGIVQYNDGDTHTIVSDDRHLSMYRCIFKYVCCLSKSPFLFKYCSVDGGKATVKTS
jgi:hypothetical protein